MGACASQAASGYPSASAEPLFDYEAYFAQIKANLSLSFIGQNMPFLIIEAPQIHNAEKPPQHGYKSVYVDGNLPQDVITEFKFEATDGSPITQADYADCPSIALLLTALVDRHGWALLSAGQGGRGARQLPTNMFVLQKAAA